MLNELEDILKSLTGKQTRGLVILSAKKNGFIAGADIQEFTELKDLSEAETLMKRGQSVCDLLEKMTVPTVSLIHGFCLGGGLELALACRYRVAQDDISTRFGLPEVKLGIHPGFGGTVRLPRLVGAPRAMDLMLSGKTVDVYEAKKMGIVDIVVPDRHLKDMAEKCIIERLPVRRLPVLLEMSNSQLVRPVLKKIIRDRTEKKINPEHFPAPFAVIDLWARFMDDPRAMFAEEARSVARLITGTTAQNLIRVFFLRNRLKALGKGTTFPVSHVHVIGAGTIGSDIAAWSALQGMRVTLQAANPKSLASAMKKAHALFTKRLINPRLVRNSMDRLMPDIRGTGLSRADVVIEAEYEDTEIKRKRFKDMEPIIKGDALIAASTSSIPLEEISLSLSKPERIVGLHLFSPVPEMSLVEIVAGKATDGEEVKKAMAFTRMIDHLPLPVKSSPGFLVNRILMPYVLEAVMMVEEGTPALTIDSAATDFGMPVGPLLLADTVGLDICLHAAETLAEKESLIVPGILNKKIKAGFTGKNSGRGFYTYKEGKQVIPEQAKGTGTDGDIRDRLILRMVNEAVACLDEGIVEDADLLDAGMVFGTGFAPFRGGIIHYCRSEGIEKVQDVLKELELKLGYRFHPVPGWERLVQKQENGEGRKHIL